MIIQSKFIDYYDKFVAKTCKDPKLVYKRETTFIDVKEIPEFLWEFTRIANRRFKRVKGGSVIRGAGFLMDSAYGVGIICINNKGYPFSVNQTTNQISYTHPYEDYRRNITVEDFHSKLYLKGFEKKIKGAKTSLLGGEIKGIEDLNKKYPVVLLYPGSEKDVFIHATANPKLSDWDFPVSVQQVAQEIMGNLAVQDKPVPKRESKEIADSKGFDKDSFRKEKGGPTRKQK